MSPRKPSANEIFDPWSGLIFNPSAVFDYVQSQWADEAEAKPLNPNTKLSAALNKCPTRWINGIAKQHDISTKGKKRDRVKVIAAQLTNPEHLKTTLARLPSFSCEALQYVVEKDGWVKIGQLTRRWGNQDEDSYFWEGHPPTSVIGRLRGNGLLFVGKAGIGGRNYKVAVVPIELRSLLSDILGMGHG